MLDGPAVAAAWAISACAARSLAHPVQRGRAGGEPQHGGGRISEDLRVVLHVDVHGAGAEQRGQAAFDRGLGTAGGALEFGKPGAPVALQHVEQRLVLGVDAGGPRRAWSGLRPQRRDLVVIEDAELAQPAAGSAVEAVQDLVGVDLQDARGARQLAEEQVVPVAGTARPGTEDDLGAAPGQPDPVGVGPLGEGVRDGRCAVGDAAQPQRPVVLAEPLGVPDGDHPQPALGAQPAVAAGDGLVGDAEHRPDAAEGGAAVHLQSVQHAQVEFVEGVGFHPQRGLSHRIPSHERR
ncbi:hypothetical protein STENM327S_03483 [Streptomyces tendae]